MAYAFSVEELTDKFWYTIRVCVMDKKKKKILFEGENFKLRQHPEICRRIVDACGIDNELLIVTVI